jgi:tetratricopeptide (TPR) repeat protein
MLNQYRYQSGQFSINFYSFKLTGTDVHSFLQSQSTYDVALMEEGSFHLVSFLDPQGRTETFGWLLKEHDQFHYLVPQSLKQISIERLNRFLISEDVEIHHPTLDEWWFVIGPKAERPDVAFEGILFDEKCWLTKLGPVSDVAHIPSELVDLWRALTGWPKFDGSNVTKEIINNQRLYDLALSQKKGCYPGQETVSKIANNRGAAYYPVLIKIDTPLSSGEISNFGKKIGYGASCIKWEDSHYLEANLIRDFRVEKMKINFDLDNHTTSGIVYYYPLIHGNARVKATELLSQASEFFKKDNFESAEECLRMAIDLDPTYGDAYESLGVMLGRLERFNEAIDLMKQLSVVDPDSVLAHTNMSLYLMRLGKIEEAEEQKSQATLKSFKHYGAEAKLKEDLEKKKNDQIAEWQKREGMFLQVLEIDEDDALANYGIGSIAVEKGEWDRARFHLEKVLKTDSKYSVAYLALGKAYLGLGLKEQAKATWVEGIRISAAKGDLMPANQMQSELDRLN